MDSISLSVEALENVIGTLNQSSYNFIYDTQKHRYEILKQDGNAVGYLRLPINYQLENPLGDEISPKFIILLVQSGSCALGCFEGEEVVDHKVIKSYMVRKKQGKSQIKYLNKKGKSRAGSRVRLANTLDFFENINDRLQLYFNEYEIDKIAVSCSKSLIPYLYNAKVACPFNKKDERLYKIPKHINLPNYDILLSSHRYLLAGELIFEESNRAIVDDLLST